MEEGEGEKCANQYVMGSILSIRPPPAGPTKALPGRSGSAPDNKWLHRTGSKPLSGITSFRTQPSALRRGKTTPKKPPPNPAAGAKAALTSQCGLVLQFGRPLGNFTCCNSLCCVSNPSVVSLVGSVSNSKKLRLVAKSGIALRTFRAIHNKTIQ